MSPDDAAKPAIFVASSSERLDIAEYVQAILQPHFDITVWTQGAFRLSRTNLDSLVRATNRSDYAILVCDPDDITLKRDTSQAAVRDNVIFELGLFIGSLGVQRTIMNH